MKRLLLFFNLLIVLVIPLAACKTSTTLSVGLSYDDAVLAKKVDGVWHKVEDAKIAKGDTVGIVFLNVSGFKKGEDGLNWMDIDVKVTNSEGSVIRDAKNLLGESGKMTLENNTAESPVGSMETTSDIPSGEYKINVTVYDRIGGGTVTCTKNFYIE